MPQYLMSHVYFPISYIIVVLGFNTCLSYNDTNIALLFSHKIDDNVRNLGRVRRQLQHMHLQKQTLKNNGAERGGGAG